MGLPRWFSGEEFACQCRRCGFNLWVGKIRWKRKWQPTPVFLPGEFHVQRSLVVYLPRSHKELDTAEWACARVHTHTHTHSKYVYTGWIPLLACCFTVLFRYYFFFSIWSFLPTLHWTSLLVSFFQQLMAHFMSLCHILVILTIFPIFQYLYM